MAEFSKAFDSLEWKCIFRTLTFLFLALPSTNGYKQFMDNQYVKSKIIATFQSNSQCQEACPISALLFVLSVEILGIQIHQQTYVQGLDFGFPYKVKTVQYAKDCIMFLNNKNELYTALNVLQSYGEISGLTLNLPKCEGLWLGSDKHRQHNCNLFLIKWPDQIRCLGITYFLCPKCRSSHKTIMVITVRAHCKCSVIFVIVSDAGESPKQSC